MLSTKTKGLHFRLDIFLNHKKHHTLFPNWVLLVTRWSVTDSSRTYQSHDPFTEDNSLYHRTTCMDNAMLAPDLNLILHFTLREQ